MIQNCLLLLLAVVACAKSVTGKRSFAVDYHKNEFIKDGEVFRYISGSLHYFQVPHELWRDRMKKMKFGGLNTLQTYIEWSLMEPSPGSYDFSGDQNITRFVEMAQEEGLSVIIRVGPFIDAERDMGGLPPWLLRENASIHLRTNDPLYIAAVDRWLKVILPILKPLLYHNGGPILMVQVENEYGSYKPACKTSGDYKTYMRDTFRALLGPEVVLFTTDGNADHFLQCGMIPEVFATIDFGSGDNVATSFEALRRFQSGGPLVNSEYYSGWLDYWEKEHQTAATEKVCSTLDKMLAMNASVNIYMYHGGTNFGFMAGSNDFGTFSPVPTSYDYDAPISEAGDLTPKFYAIKDVIRKYFPVSDDHDSKTIQSVAQKMELPPTKMELKASIFDLLPEPVFAKEPQPFERLNHSYGFVLYSANLTFQPTDPAILTVNGLHDRAQVFVDKEYAGTLSVTRKSLTLSVLALKGSTLDIFVENQGRLCYGNDINQRRGILSAVQLDGVNVTGWNHYKIYNNWRSQVMDKLTTAKPSPMFVKPRMPSFYLGSFQLPNKPDYPLDSFLQVTGWTKGQAFLNGHNLGRYWPVAGPQETLYAPSVYFHAYPAQNYLVLLELERAPCSSSGANSCTAQFVTKHVINGTVPYQVTK